MTSTNKEKATTIKTPTITPVRLMVLMVVLAGKAVVGVKSAVVVAALEGVVLPGIPMLGLVVPVVVEVVVVVYTYRVLQIPCNREWQSLL